MPESANEAALILFEISESRSDWCSLKMKHRLPAALQEHLALYGHPVRRSLSGQLWSVFAGTAGKFGFDPENLSFDHDGKPMLADGWISASHTDGSGALLLAGVPCGVDIEAINRRRKSGPAAEKNGSECLNLDRLIARTASSIQQRAIAGSEEDFYRLWTQKEAQIKLGSRYASIPVRDLPDWNAEIFCFEWNGCFGSVAFEKGQLPEKISVYGYDPALPGLLRTEGLRFQSVWTEQKEQEMYDA